MAGGKCGGGACGGGAVWFGGWLFTLGYLHLHVWKAMLAILLWPYYLGTALGR